MKLKIYIRNKEYIIDENSLILDNGAIYQLVSHRVSWIDASSPVISKKMFKDLKTLAYVYTNEDLKEESKRRYISDCTLYKFDIKRMSKHKDYRIEGEVYE